MDDVKNKIEADENLNKLLSLSKEDLERIFSQLSLSELEDMLQKLNEVVNND